MALLPNQMLNPAFLTRVVNEKPSKAAIKQNYRVPALLPWEDIPVRQAVYDIVMSENNLAGVYAPDGQAIPGDDIIFSTALVNLIDIKSARTLDPLTVQQIREPGSSQIWEAGATGAGLAQMTNRKVMDHTNWCNEVIDSMVEYIGMQALGRGTVTWPPVDNAGATIAIPMPHWNAGMTLNFNFPLPALQNQNASTLVGHNALAATQVPWTTYATANPIRDLQVINQYMLKTKGVSMRGGTIIMSEIVLDHLSQIASFRDLILGNDESQSGARDFLDIENIKSAIKTKTGYTIETYDAQWTYRVNVPHTKPTIQRVDFLKEGKVIIMPPGGPVGSMMNTLLKTGPEPNAPWAYRKVPWVKFFDEPPWNIKIGLDSTAWPRFEHYDWFILDAYQ